MGDKKKCVNEPVSPCHVFSLASSCKPNILQFGQINLVIKTNTQALWSSLAVSSPWLLIVDQIFCFPLVARPNLVGIKGKQDR